MVIVELIEIFDIISVESIYCPIYLVSKFKIQDDIKTTVAHHKTSDDFREFYINSYIDQHAFINYYWEFLYKVKAVYYNPESK